MRTDSRSGGFSALELLFVVALIGVIGAIAVPQLTHSLSYFRISGDARSISNAVALTKMRAASNFSRTRLHVDRAGRSFQIERGDNATPTQ